MEMSGEHRIPAPRAVVWDALNDPEVLKASIPGCESLVQNEAGDALDAQVRAKVGPVSAKFAGSVTLSDINPPEGYTISGEGKGGAAGFAKGGAKVHLAEDGEETILSYSAEAKVGGKLAQLGSRLIDGTARKMADDFFARFSAIVAERHAGGAMPAEGAAPAAAEPAAQPAAEPAAPLAASTPPVEAAAAAARLGADTAPGTPPEATAEATTAPVPPSAAAAEPPPAPPTGTAATPERPATQPTATPEPARRGLSPLVWVGALVALVAILLAIFS